MWSPNLGGGGLCLSEQDVEPASANVAGFYFLATPLHHTQKVSLKIRFIYGGGGDKTREDIMWSYLFLL